MKRFVVFLILFGLLINGINAQEEKSRKQKKQEKREAEFAMMDSLIATKVYRFEASKANPTGGGQVDLTTHSADLTIQNDSVISYLPFFGRAYNVAYGSNEGGIKFETLLIDYNVEKNAKKLSFDVAFSAKTDNDSYQCYLSISSSGSASLSITSVNRAGISYYGNIVPIPVKNK